MSRVKFLAAILLLITPLGALSGRADDLKLLVSVQQQNVVVPNPVRATLHFHNSGRETLWLYRPVRSKQVAGADDSFPPAIGGHGTGRAYGESNVEVHLEATEPSGNGKEPPSGGGFALTPDALPFPRLVRLAPGEDYDEKVTLHVEPALEQRNGGHRALWGQYTFSVSYSADYSNAETLARDINANLWHGQASSNSITLDLQPPRAQGSIAGTVLDSVGRPYGGALVTLSDENENALGQVYSDITGRFSFANLVLGSYWITVRQPGSNQDTSVFRQVDLNQGDSPAMAKIMMLPVDADKPDRLLHKPVLFHIVDNQGRALAKIKLAVLSSTGTIVETLKAQTGEDGFTALGLIPGAIFITLERQGCKKKEDRRADVEPGPGVDGFKFVFECSRE
jgi:Carboxypeptidase regulatory-like domain